MILIQGNKIIVLGPYLYSVSVFIIQMIVEIIELCFVVNNRKSKGESKDFVSHIVGCKSNLSYETEIYLGCFLNWLNQRPQLTCDIYTTDRGTTKLVSQQCIIYHNLFGQRFFLPVNKVKICPKFF